MDDADVGREIHRVDHTVRLSLERERDLEYALLRALLRLRDIGLAASLRGSSRIP